VWALGVVLVRAFARTGACLQFTGAQHGIVSDLALLPLGPDDKPSPVEGVFSNERREDLERCGLAVVQIYQRDTAFVGAVRSFRKPPRYPDAEANADAAQQVTLAYQLYVSRVVKFLGRAVPLLSGLESPEAVKAELRKQVLRLLSTPEKPLRADHVGIEVRDHPDDASLYLVSLRALPEITIAGRPANLLMSFAVRR
jgi:predicted component of type VI protein secretion system